MKDATESRLHFLGAAGTVTGSPYLVESQVRGAQRAFQALRSVVAR